MPSGDVAFDTETTGLDWDKGDVPFLVQWADADNLAGDISHVGPAKPAHLTPAEKRAQADKAYEALMGSRRLVGANLGFDVHMAHTLGWDLLAPDMPLLDIQDLARIVLPERRFASEEEGRGYKLKDLSHDLYDANAKDSEEVLQELAKQHGFSLKAKPGTRDYVPQAYYRLWELEPEAMEFYGREDVRLTYGTLGELEKRLTEGTRNIWELEQSVKPIVLAAERAGITVDAEKALPLRAEYVKQSEELRAELDKTLPSGWDENNEKLAEALLSAGVPLTEKTDSGDLATNKWALERLKDDHPIIQTLFDYRQASKFVSTYLDHFIDTTVIHPHFEQIGTWTGRMAGNKPNMQNVPARAGKAIRELFIPRPGMCFVAIDFEQIEFRALCYYLNDRRMVELMEAGHDPFAKLAADVFGGDAADYRKGAKFEDKRTICKNTTYAVIYGAGGMKVAKMLGWKADSVYQPGDWVVQRGYKQAGDPRSKAAEQLIKRLKAALVGYGAPGYKGVGTGSGLMGRISDKVTMTGAVDTILGRRQWLGYDKAYKGLSGLIQGSAADLFKLALIDAVEAVKPLGAYPLLFIHDEIVFECPIENAKEVEALASKAMCESYPLRPALAVESHIAYNNWGEAK